MNIVTRRPGLVSALGLLAGSCLSAAALSGCSANRAEPAAAAATKDVEQLASWLEGQFSSQAQAATDPSYFDIRLHMGRIWTERTDGPWLYVEQARADMLDTPYRQRVYRVSRRDDGALLSAVYTLPEPVTRFAGALSRPDGQQVFKELAPEQLKPLDGCTVVLRFDPARGAYIGGTEGEGCASTREGAKYTTSQIVLTREQLDSWDRGFDAQGQQVWGAVGGGYQFVRQSP